MITADGSADSDRIGAEFAARFASAWNRHEMEDFGLLFRDDASFVNVVGVRMRGRDEIRQAHANIHAGPYRDSHLLVEVEGARELVPGVIIADWHTQLSGDERAPGVIRASRLTVVIDRRGDEWGIAAAQNTFVLTPPGGP